MLYPRNLWYLSAFCSMKPISTLHWGIPLTRSYYRILYTKHSPILSQILSIFAWNRVEWGEAKVVERISWICFGNRDCRVRFHGRGTAPSGMELLQMSQRGRRPWEQTLAISAGCRQPEPPSAIFVTCIYILDLLRIAWRGREVNAPSILRMWWWE